MASTVPDRLADVKCQSLKCAPRTGETVLQLTEPQAQLVARAIRNAGLKVDTAARHMGISESLLNRQLQGKEHLSWQRMSLLPDEVFYELLILLGASKGIARVTTKIEMERKVSALNKRSRWRLA